MKLMDLDKSISLIRHLQHFQTYKREIKYRSMNYIKNTQINIFLNVLKSMYIIHFKTFISSLLEMNIPNCCYNDFSILWNHI